MIICIYVLDSQRPEGRWRGGFDPDRGTVTVAGVLGDRSFVPVGSRVTRFRRRQCAFTESFLQGKFRAGVQTNCCSPNP